MLIQVLVSFIATVSFALLFNVPRREYIYCGITGAIGWFFYLLVNSALSSAVFSPFVASLVITIISRIFAVNRKLPVTIFLISGIFTFVPGAGIYYTAYYLFANELSMAASKGVETISVAIAIAFGIMLVFVIPQKAFLWKRDKS